MIFFHKSRWWWPIVRILFFTLTFHSMLHNYIECVSVNTLHVYDSYFAQRRYEWRIGEAASTVSKIDSACGGLLTNRHRARKIKKRIKMYGNIIIKILNEPGMWIWYVFTICRRCLNMCVLYVYILLLFGSVFLFCCLLLSAKRMPNRPPPHTRLDACEWLLSKPSVQHTVEWYIIIIILAWSRNMLERQKFAVYGTVRKCMGVCGCIVQWYGMHVDVDVPCWWGE